MQLTYLCPKHADWVYSNPREALHFLRRDELQGSLLFQSGQYSEAIPYLGCAFDIAAILLELEEDSSAPLIDTVKALSYQLAMAYQGLGRMDCHQAIFTRVSLLLMAVASHHQAILQEYLPQTSPQSASGWRKS